MIERRRRFSGRDLLLDMQFPSVPADHSSICRCILKSPRIGLMSFGMISYVREKQHEREIMPEKPPRAVIWVADLFAKSGSNQKEMSSPGRISGSNKSRRIQRTLRLLLVSSICAQSKTTT
jgi:hypothetical protein